MTDQNLQPSLFDGITGGTPAAVDIPFLCAAGAVPSPAAPAIEDNEKVLFYDVKKHGKLEPGDIVYLFEDGSFLKEGQHGK
jgi:hypothetical protein